MGSQMGLSQKEALGWQVQTKGILGEQTIKNQKNILDLQANPGIFGTERNFIIADGLTAMISGAVNEGRSGTDAEYFIVNINQRYPLRRIQPRQGLDGDGRIIIHPPTAPLTSAWA